MTKIHDIEFLIKTGLSNKPENSPEYNKKLNYEEKILEQPNTGNNYKNKNNSSINTIFDGCSRKNVIQEWQDIH